MCVENDGKCNQNMILGPWNNIKPLQNKDTFKKYRGKERKWQRWINMEKANNSMQIFERKKNMLQQGVEKSEKEDIKILRKTTKNRLKKKGPVCPDTMQMASTKVKQKCKWGK